MKIIVINGPTGIGKSTIASKIHQDLPLAFLLSIDEQRRYISHYRENRIESRDLVHKIALDIVNNYLQTGNDIIIDGVITDIEFIEKIIQIGQKHNAQIFEFILNSDKDTLIKRAKERGFREGGLLTPEKVIEFWHNIQIYIRNRPDSQVLNTENLTIEETYEFIKEKLLIEYKLF
ncbi:MAG: AAA family ATPase [Candidatus Paceibacterota bacterium]